MPKKSSFTEGVKQTGRKGNMYAVSAIIAFLHDVDIYLKKGYAGC